MCLFLKRFSKNKINALNVEHAAKLIKIFIALSAHNARISLFSFLSRLAMLVAKSYFIINEVISYLLFQINKRKNNGDKINLYAIRI